MLTLKYIHMVRLITENDPYWTFFQDNSPLKCYAQKAYTLELIAMHFNLCDSMWRPRRPRGSMIALISPNRLIVLSAAGVGSQNSPFVLHNFKEDTQSFS